MRDFEIINDNLRHALAAFSYARPTGVIHSVPGLSLVSAGVPYSLFNTALLLVELPGNGSSFGSMLHTARDYFVGKKQPWSIWFCDSLLSSAERRASRLALASAELKLMMDTPGMIADVIAPEKRRLPRMIYERVATERTRRHFTEIMSTAFSVPHDMALDVYGCASLWTGPLTGWVGYVAGEAFATACTVVGGGVVGLYAVGTRPDQQRRGYGEAIVRHAVRTAQIDSGLSPVVLQSSSAGYALYISMGFRNVTRFNVYVKSN